MATGLCNDGTDAKLEKKELPLPRERGLLLKDELLCIQEVGMGGGGCYYLQVIKSANIMVRESKKARGGAGGDKESCYLQVVKSANQMGRKRKKNLYLY